MKSWTDGKRTAVTKRNSRSGLGASMDAPFFLYAALALGVFVFILWPTLVMLKESVYIDGSLSFEHYRSLLLENRTLLKNSLFVGFLDHLVRPDDRALLRPVRDPHRPLGKESDPVSSAYDPNISPLRLLPFPT